MAAASKLPGAFDVTCQEFIETLHRYLSGELSQGARAEADLHLRICPDCVNYLRSYEVTIRLGKGAFEKDGETDEVPDDLVDVVLSARRRRD